MKQHSPTLRLTQLSLLVAVILLMKLTGLSSIPIGPLNMTLTMVPIGIGAMLLGPSAGALLGTVYGLSSFYDAATGASVMTGIFFQNSPLHTFVLCVVMRAVVGAVSGFLFQCIQRIDRTNTVCCYIGGLVTPLLNTALFMGYLVLVFYRTDYVQERIQVLGAETPLQFVLFSVGIQGLVEALTGMLVSGSAVKAIDAAVHLQQAKQKRRTQC